VNHLKKQLRVEQPGPGYLHFGTASTDDFLRELFPWKSVPKTKDRREYKWEKPPGSRDEGGDCTRMAYVALQLVSRRYNRATMWDQLEAQVKASIGSKEGTARPTVRRRNFSLKY